MNDLKNSTSMSPVASIDSPVWYKHKLIAKFAVGKHEFTNHIYQITDEEVHQDFLRQVDGLLVVDQVNIVQVMNIDNERPIDTRTRVTRGGSTSDKAALFDQAGDARAEELRRREEELNQREINLAKRERESLRAIKQGEVDPAPDAGDDPRRASADSTLNPHAETSQDFGEADFKTTHAPGTTVEEVDEHQPDAGGQGGQGDEPQIDPAPPSDSLADGNPNPPPSGNGIRLGGGLKLGTTPKTE